MTDAAVKLCYSVQGDPYELLESTRRQLMFRVCFDFSNAHINTLWRTVPFLQEVQTELAQRSRHQHNE